MCVRIEAPYQSSTRWKLKWKYINESKCAKKYHIFQAIDASLNIHFGQSFQFEHAHDVCLSKEENKIFYTRIELLQAIHERPHREKKCVQYYLLVLKINSILWIVCISGKVKAPTPKKKQHYWRNSI